MSLKMSRHLAAVLMAGLMLPIVLPVMSAAAPYPEKEVTGFLTSCTNECTAQLKQYKEKYSKVCQSSCACTIKHFQSEIPHEQFNSYFMALKNHTTPPQNISSKIQQIANTCTFQTMNANGLRPATGH